MHLGLNVIDVLYQMIFYLVTYFFVAQLYDKELGSVEQLKAELIEVRCTLTETQSELDRLRNLKSSTSVSTTDVNNERRVKN